MFLLGAAFAPAYGATIANNLGAPPFMSVPTTASGWAAQSFITDANTYTLNSITLLMGALNSGDTGTLALYSGNALPTTFVADLVSPGSYTTITAPNVFTTPGISLAANTTYWAVLSSTSGVLSWAYTLSLAGSGVAFNVASALSGNSGGSWSVSATQPFQDSVSATVSGAGSTPEPSTALLFAAGLAAVAVARKKLAPSSATR